VQLAEHDKAAHERETDADANHQQIEEKRPHAAEYDNDKQDCAASDAVASTEASLVAVRDPASAKNTAPKRLI